GDAAVGNPGLDPVETDVAGPVGFRGGCERTDVGASLRFRQRESGDMTAIAYRRQVLRLQFVTAEKRDRAGPQALHGESEVGETVVPGENFPRQAKRADVKLVRQPAKGRRHD